MSKTTCKYTHTCTPVHIAEHNEDLRNHGVDLVMKKACLMEKEHRVNVAVQIPVIIMA